jgi:hypothetical protein
MGREVNPINVIRPMVKEGHTMNKKRIAKEWLYFLGCFAFGFFVLPLLLFIIVAPMKGLKFGKFYSEFYDPFSGGEGFWFFWLFVLGPYLLFQLIRSIVWAWKTVGTQ